jgi:hypothetical protein
MMGRMDDWTNVKHHFIHLSRHCRALACVPSLPIAFFAALRLYSTLFSPCRSKQTMTEWMDDRMNMKHHFIHLSCHCRALACVPSLPIAFSAAPHLYSTLSLPRQSKQTMTRRMDDGMDGQMNDGTDG